MNAARVDVAADHVASLPLDEVRALAVQLTSCSVLPSERERDDRIWAARAWLRANDPRFDIEAAIRAADTAPAP